MTPKQSEVAIEAAYGFLSSYDFPLYLGRVDYRAAAILRLAEAARSCEPMPMPECEKLLRVAMNTKPRRKRGTDPFTYVFRNILIAGAVRHVCKKFELPPTRNRATRDRESGCSIVARACSRLGHDIAEDTLDTIWRQGNSLIKLIDSGDARPWIFKRLVGNK
jgi:hypothetical protein